MLLSAQSGGNGSMFGDVETSGVTASSSKAHDLLFATEDCLCMNQTECKPLGDALYQATHSGMDRMMLKFLEVAKYMAGVSAAT